jgi:LacI family transcriptional regulator
MSHRYRVREIAQQAGLSEATVDRVLHNRANVRESTRREVEQAIGDLDKQRSQLRLAGRKYLVDVVMQAPQRFSSAFQEAVEAELPALAPAVVRSRFHFRETGSVPAMVETLDKIGARGSHGVIVKAPDTDLVAEAIDRLTAEGIPVVTFVTDVPRSSRVGYVGVDNRDAGATAAYLIDQWLGDSPASVLVTLSSNAFRGEEEREMGFRGELRRALGAAGRAVVEIAESEGLDATIEQLVLDALDRDPTIGAVYSTGGGNVATIRAFERGRSYRVFIAHDLDEDNRTLLRARKISAVLHHDARRRQHRRAADHSGARRDTGVAPSMSAIRVVTAQHGVTRYR